MAFLDKTYTLVGHEKFDDFLKSVGIPEDKVAAIAGFKSTQKLVKDGDTYTYISAAIEGPKEVKFQSGVEFDDVIGPEKNPIKTTYTVEGNVVTQVVKADKGSATFKREYNGDDLTVTITSDQWDGVAKRFYKA